jgi:hypothetical protein
MMSSSASCLCISILMLLLYAPAYSQPFGIDHSSLLTRLYILGKPNPIRGVTQTCVQLYQTVTSNSSSITALTKKTRVFRPEDSIPFPKWLPAESQILDWANQRTRAPRFDETRWSKTSPSQYKFCGDRYKLSCILAMLPDKETCEKLYNLFLSLLPT